MSTCIRMFCISSSITLHFILVSMKLILSNGLPKENFKNMTTKTICKDKNSVSTVSANTIEVIDNKYLVITVIVLLFFSCFFGSLNLTLTSITVLDLKLYEKTGGNDEKKYASKLLFIRQRGNFLLITLLICNVFVNCSTTVLVHYILNKTFSSILLSVLLITVFGGIIPYAMSSRYGLLIAARATWITIFFMAITSPISFPIGMLIDKIMGKNMWETYSRDELRELIIDHGDRGFVNRGEMNIITGALTLSTKKVKDVMRRLEESFMIPEDAILDFETMSEIVSHGYTRVPVYANEDKRNICGLLNIKDLAFIDPNDRTPLKTVCRFYQRDIILVDAEKHLDSILNEFCQGKAHMAFVDIIKPDVDGELRHQIIGLVTLEDVIEEILQADILDESDVYDERLHTDYKKQIIDFSLFCSSKKGIGLSPEMKLAVFQHLSSNVSVFGPHLILREVLQCFLNEDNNVISYSREPGRELGKIYEDGKPANFAILILQGQVRVILIREQLVCVGGPFMFFGESMLIEVNKISGASPFEIIKAAERLPPHLPDYTVEPVGNLEYLRITRQQYAMARQASMLKRTANIDFQDWTRRRSEEERRDVAANGMPRLCADDRRVLIRRVTSTHESSSSHDTDLKS